MCNTDTKYTDSKKGSFPNSLILIACTKETFKACVVYYCVTESMEVPRLIGVQCPLKKCVPMHYCFCLVKFIYSEKATKFCEIFTLVLSYVVVKILSILVVFLENMNFIHCTSLNAARSLAMPQSVSARILHASEAFCSSFSMPLLHSLSDPRPSIHNTHLSCLHISIAIKKMLVW